MALLLPRRTHWLSPHSTVKEQVNKGIIRLASCVFVFLKFVIYPIAFVFLATVIYCIKTFELTTQKVQNTKRTDFAVRHIIWGQLTNSNIYSPCKQLHNKPKHYKKQYMMKMGSESMPHLKATFLCNWFSVHAWPPRATGYIDGC